MNIFENNKTKIALATGLMFLSGTALGQFCPPPYFNEWVKPTFTAATNTLNTLIHTWDSTFALELKTENEMLMSAMSVLVKQQAVTSNQIATTQHNTMQTIATAIGMLSKQEAIKKARLDYGGEFGQGYNPCGVLAGRRVLSDVAEGVKEESATRSSTEVYASSGRLMSPAVVQDAMLSDHAKNFCTSNQKDSGLCDVVGSMAGKDLTVSTLFEFAAEGSPMYNAKVAFINNIVGLPVDPIPKEAGGTAAGQSAMLAKMNKDAVVSIAISSLKSIQLHYSAINTGHTNTGVSEAQLLDNEVKRYSGDSGEYDAWTKVMSAQTDRGALVELLKVKSLNLALLAREYEQNEKIEANLAALVAIGARGKNKSKTSSDLTKQNSISDSIK